MSGPCSALVYEDAHYTVCTIDPRRYDIRMFWQGADGSVYGSFDRLTATPAGRNLAFAMNAGMYAEDRSPVGLYIENGRELKRANTAGGPGNFHLKPNGIFYIAGGKAGVLDTARFLKRRPHATFATQSGPMLVIDGKIHPKISDNGPSLKIRNGVGVRPDGKVVFAMSEQRVSFGAFARLFRNRLDSRNALFLDGSISSLYAPNLGRSDRLMPLGPIVGAIPK